MSECEYNLLSSSNDKCEYVSSCDTEFFFFSLLKFHYCILDGRLYFTLPIYLLLILLCFFLLSDTANKYFSGTLTIISDKLKLSQNIAAMTLLALGNGAPDIISSIVASFGSNDSNEDSSFDMSVGALLGSGMVLTTLVFSLVIFFSKDGVKVIPKMFLREGLFYIFALIVLIIFAIDKTVYLWEALCFILIYFINLVVAILIQKRHDTLQTQLSNGEISETPSDEHLNNTNNINENQTFDEELQTTEVNNQNTTTLDETNNEADQKNVKRTLVHRDTNIINLENLVENIAEIAKSRHILRHNDTDEEEEKSIKDLNKKSIKILKKKQGLFFRIKRHYFNHLEDFSNLNLYQKVVYILIEFPFTILRDLTIPAVEENKYHKKLFALFPIFSLLGAITLLNQWSLAIEYYYVTISLCGVSIVASVLFFIFLKETIPERILPICFITFIMSIVWIYSITNIIVDTIDFLGLIFNIPDSFLGLTILSIGNSAPDTGLNCSLAKTGFGEMAIAGTIAGPFFNLIIGLGFSLLLKVYKGPVKFSIFGDNSAPNLIAFICLSINLIVNMIIAKINNYHLKKINAYISLTIFFVYVVLISVFTFK